MSFTLHSATVPTFQQILGAVAGLIDKAEAHCRAQALPAEELLQARLAPDMFTFAHQIKATVAHSAGAIEAVRKGVYTPDLSPPLDTFAALRQQIEGGIAVLAKVTPAELEARLARDTRFEFKDTVMPFTSADFLFSFALPNFFFHATTAYDILRWKGVQIGKRDFLGRLRLKQG